MGIDFQSRGWFPAVISKVKKRLREPLEATLPRIYSSLASRRSRRLIHRLELEWGCIELTRKFLNRHGATVRAGPFEGLRFPACTFQSHIVPKLVGSYEKELHPWIATLAGKQYAQIINIGAAEGYYANGFSRLFPAIPVIAFDTDGWARARRTRDGAIESPDERFNTFILRF